MALLDLLLPPACASCGCFGAILCDACIGSFGPANRLDDRFVAPDPGAVVGEHLTLGVAAFAYGGALRSALQRLKYAGASRVAAPLAAATLPTLRRLFEITGPAPLVPIPLHLERERERGYNQTGLLADALGATAGIQVRRLLRRERPTTRQHRLDRAARLANLVRAFVIAEAERAPPAVILIDDILTTSATMEACAAVLRSAGSAEVYGLAIAREV